MKNIKGKIASMFSILLVAGLPRTSAFTTITSRNSRIPALMGRSDIRVTENLSKNFNHKSLQVSSSSITNISKQPTPIVIDAIQQLVGKDTPMHNVLPVAAFALAVAVLLGSPVPANAAMSGGRMGGSFSRSGGSGVTRMAPSTRSYNYYGGSSYYSRPSAIISAPIIVPFVNPFPPVYYGGPGVISYSRGPGLFDFLILGGIGFFILNAIRSATAFGSGTLTTWTEPSSNLFSSGSSSALGPGSSVIQLSIALNVPNRDDPNSILSVFDRLARTAKTNSRVGVQNLTSQVALELLRRKSSFSGAFSRYKHFSDANQAQREFNTWSVKERSKFEKELVNKYGGVDYYADRDSSLKSNTNGATMAVVTLVLSIAGDSTKVPRIQSATDVDEALRLIASNSKVDDCLTGSEILWTPEERSETLSFRDVIADYPELVSL